MDCAHEVAILEKRLGTLGGVVTLDADVLSRQLRVHYDGATLSAAGIAEAVAQTGMRAWPVTASGEPARVQTGVPWAIVAAGAACVAAAGLWVAGVRGPWIRVALVLSIVLTAPGTLRRAWQAVRGRRLDIHVLMTVAVAGALAIDEWFEAATVLVLFGVAQALEARSLARARRAIADVLTVTPPTADLLSANGRMQTVPVEQVAIGQTVSVRPGARLPLDGIVTDGESTVNQAPVTGESDPVLKVRGDVVYAGAVNGDGTLAIEVTRVSTDSTVARIVHQVERAHAARAQVQTAVDRFAAVYTPVVLILAAALAVLPPLLAGASWLAWIERALVLLVVACPCALVIATPVAMVSALSAAARRGLLLKGGAVLERLAAIRVVAFDKTGTASEGQLRIATVTPLGTFPEARALATGGLARGGCPSSAGPGHRRAGVRTGTRAAAGLWNAAPRRAWRDGHDRRAGCPDRPPRLAGLGVARRHGPARRHGRADGRRRARPRNRRRGSRAGKRRRGSGGRDRTGRASDLAVRRSRRRRRDARGRGARAGVARATAARGQGSGRRRPRSARSRAHGGRRHQRRTGARRGQRRPRRRRRRHGRCARGGRRCADAPRPDARAVRDCARTGDACARCA